jgi:hypothetical protein
VSLFLFQVFFCTKSEKEGIDVAPFACKFRTEFIVAHWEEIDS